MITIDQVLVINLDRRVDRWTHFINQSRNSNIINNSYNRISAIDGLSLIDKDIDAYLTIDAINHMRNKTKTGGLRMSYGAAGLAITYHSILNSCTNNILLLEDDILIDSEFDTIVLQTLENTPDDWDIIYFGWYDSQELIIDRYNNYVNLLSGKINGTQAWMVNAESAKKIVSMFPITYQIDTELYLDRNIVKYASKTPVVKKALFDSDIQIR